MVTALLSSAQVCTTLPLEKRAGTFSPLWPLIQRQVKQMGAMACFLRLARIAIMRLFTHGAVFKFRSIVTL
jgi:hypothetical protein